MANYRRFHVPGATYFFTVCLEDRASSALVDHIAVLRAAYAATVREMPLRSQTVVVLPNHLHAIWTLPPDDDNFPERWRKIKARFSHSVRPSVERTPSKASRREKGIWQRRYWEHMIRGLDDFAQHFEFCRLDPVRHGLVAHPADWPYSSFNHAERRMGNIAHPT